MSADEQAQFEAMLEALTHVRVEQILAQAIQELVSVGSAKAGLIPEAPDAADPDQARLAIEAIAGLGSLLESRVPADALGEVKQALAQLQMGYVRLVEAQGGTPAGQGGPAGPGGGPGGPAPGAPPPRPGAAARRAAAAPEDLDAARGTS